MTTISTMLLANRCAAEVMTMLCFDLRQSLAGRQVYQMGRQEGAIKTARQMVLQVLTERFGIVPKELRDQLRTIKEPEVLTVLHSRAVRCSDLENFREVLLKAD